MAVGVKRSIEAANRARRRALMIRDTVADIRQVEQTQGGTRQSLAEIKALLLALAAHDELFPDEDFPAPGPEDAYTYCMYRVSEDDDHRFALYLNATSGRCDTPAHDHKTWAVIVGIHGDEQNRFYQRSANNGIEQTGGVLVTTGTGVAFLPDDLHSIHIRGAALNFHMYGLALEQLHEREYFCEVEQCWKIFPADNNIQEARSL